MKFRNDIQIIYYFKIVYIQNCSKIYFYLPFLSLCHITYIIIIKLKCHDNIFVMLAKQPAQRIFNFVYSVGPASRNHDLAKQAEER
jgi:hypothetical protein